jgi:hypothetical protein
MASRNLYDRDFGASPKAITLLLSAHVTFTAPDLAFHHNSGEPDPPPQLPGDTLCA